MVGEYDLKKARKLKKDLLESADLYITKSCFYKDRYYLSERYYPCVEVVWTDKMRLTKEQAQKLIDEEIATVWSSAVEKEFKIKKK